MTGPRAKIEIEGWLAQSPRQRKRKENEDGKQSLHLQVLEAALFLEGINLGQVPLGRPLGQVAPLEVGVAVAETTGKRLRHVKGFVGAVRVGERHWRSRHELDEEALELHCAIVALL